MIKREHFFFDIVSLKQNNDYERENTFVEVDTPGCEQGWAAWALSTRTTILCSPLPPIEMLLDPLTVTKMLKGTFKIKMSHLVPIKIKLFNGIKTIESAVHQEPGGKNMIPLNSHVRKCIHFTDLWNVIQIVTYLRLFLFSLSTLTLLSPSKVRPGISTSRFLFSSSRRKLSKLMNTWEGRQL